MEPLPLLLFAWGGKWLPITVHMLEIIQQVLEVLQHLYGIG